MAMQGDLEDVAAAIRSELRLEAEEAEREAAVSAAMRRDVADVARELMAHGDTVAIDAGHRRFVGHIMAVGSDVVTIDTQPRRVDVNLKTLQRMRVAGTRWHGRRPALAHFRTWLASVNSISATSGTSITSG